MQRSVLLSQIYDSPFCTLLSCPSSVRRCVQRSTGKEYAVKVVSKYKSDTDREVAILKLVQGHPNIIKLVDYFQDDLHAYIVTELMRGGAVMCACRLLSSQHVHPHIHTCMHAFTLAHESLHTRSRMLAHTLPQRDTHARMHNARIHAATSPSLICWTAYNSVSGFHNTPLPCRQSAFLAMA